jgi:hypothetical protein
MYLVLSSNKVGKTKEGLHWYKNQGAVIQIQNKFTMRPSSNKAGMPWLTFPFESSSMTYPIWI